jgi:hypothetical protein
MPDQKFYADLASRGVTAVDEHLARRSAVFDTEYSKHRRAADDAGVPFELQGGALRVPAAVEALLKADAAERAVTDNSASIPLGVNHFNALKRYEGQEAYDRAVRAAFKADAEGARRLGLVEPPRIGQ